ncbi:YeiH family protein [Staphylococcus xylosus]|uniref:YeiH family putative sulfate export transporter n=1 Tax=Staphylococcus xylosus TaxID=1288 RepID=A0AAQ0RXN7_STAXY|nr:YeiH family protein [Staphylococcus xylosus]PTI55087.1 putative sulfate exporter family transporter [Staphylococcus xylosus]PTI55733.1 putative sulfate exporter family transporter [Staphylococcus xylosus]RIM66657.1 YeiH family putative sulfate export transporter [Staphylococcus xylosus]RIM92502.1 YeiH family putative sulfate export transporter [Staphylococcus xylosus]
MTTFNNKSFIFGILFTFIIAAISLISSKLPLLDKVGALTIAIVIAILFRHFKGYPESYRPGITFASKRLLKFAIILYGLKLNIFDVIEEGSTLLLIDGGVIIVSIGLMLLLNHYIKGDKAITLLLGIGTGVCGAAAIAAVSPILKSREKDTAISIGIVALIGTLFSLAYTVIYTLFTISPEVYGVWSGVSLHEIAHVILATDFSGETALRIGLLGKLGRVFLLIPLSIVLIFVMNLKSQARNTNQRIEMPYFLIGFVLMAIFHTYVPIPQFIMQIIEPLTTICLLMAMVALGLNVSFKDLQDRAFKPLIGVIIVSVILSTITFIIANSIYG